MLFSDNYILVGHSAGATLALQLMTGPALLHGQAETSMPLPASIIGISGIYDLVGLADRHEGYDEFISAAFGTDKTDWKRVSPMHFTGSFSDSLSSQRPVLLAWSTGDTLIDVDEIDGMAARLKSENCNLATLKDLHGGHDYVWVDGSQVAALVAKALDMLGENTSIQ